MIITGSIFIAQPLGPKVQEKLTTSGEPGNLTIKQIVRYERQGAVLHRLLTADVIPAAPAMATDALES